MFLNKVFAAVLSATALVVAAYPDPRSCSGNCVAIDTAVIRRDSDGAYFRFNTFGNIGIYKGTTLDGPWVFQGAAITAGSVIPVGTSPDNLWAPDVKKVGSEYIMYYSVSSGGSQTSAIGYATSSTMEYGTWTDYGATGISSTGSSPYNAIDPTLFLDPVTSAYYMTFGSYWGGIYVVQMNSAATQVASGATYTNLAYAPSGAHALEGSNMYYRNNYYYLFTSVGDSGSFNNASLPAAGAEYHVFVCRSSSITGPFVDSAGVSCLNGGGDLLLASHDYVYAPGGQGLFEDPTFGTVMYYHYANIDVSLEKTQFQLGWNAVAWTSDNWPFLTT